MSAVRRNARLRREYMYRKGLEGKERILYEKKRKIKMALAEGKPIPTELKHEVILTPFAVFVVITSGLRWGGVDRRRNSSGKSNSMTPVSH